MSPPFPFVLAGSECFELIKQIGIVPAIVAPQNIINFPNKKDLPASFSLKCAKDKAIAAKYPHPNTLIFAAATVFACGRRILSSVETTQEARKHLELFSGRRHQIYTSLYLITPVDEEYSRTVKTTITFKNLSQTQIDSYLNSQEWKGTYGYNPQGIGGHFIKQINGSPSNLLGLPLFETYNLLQNPLGLK